MPRGNEIIVSANPQGKFLEGVIGDTSKPGTVMQIKAATAMNSGRHTWIAAAPGTDGKCVLGAILLADQLQGKLNTDAYVSGTRCFLYCPVAGEELNLLLGEVAGTGNSYAIGDRVIINATAGYLIPETGSPQETLAVVMETVTQAAGSSLTWCTWIK